MKSPKTGDKSPGKAEKVNTTAHLLETAGHHISHAHEHLKVLNKPQSPKQRALNHDHAMTHLKGGIEHVQKLVDHIQSNYPAEAKAYNSLKESQPQSLKARLKDAHDNILKGK